MNLLVYAANVSSAVKNNFHIVLFILLHFALFQINGGLTLWNFPFCYCGFLNNHQCFDAYSIIWLQSCCKQSFAWAANSITVLPLIWRGTPESRKTYSDTGLACPNSDADSDHSVFSKLPLWISHWSAQAVTEHMKGSFLQEWNEKIEWNSREQTCRNPKGIEP